VVSALVLAAVIAAGLTGLGLSHRLPQATLPAPRTVGTVPVTVPLTSTAFSFPAGYGLPHDLVADQAGAGVWFPAESAGEVRLFHWDATSGALTSLLLLSSPTVATTFYLGEGSVFAMQGRWAVVGTSTPAAGAAPILLDADTVSGTVQTLSLPDPGTGTMAAGADPHTVQAAAIAADGRVAYALTAESGVGIWNPASGTYSSIPVPGGGDADDLAFAPDGTLVMAVDGNGFGAPDEVAIATTGGTATLLGGVGGGLLSPDADGVLVRTSSGVRQVFPSGAVTAPSVAAPGTVYADDPVVETASGRYVVATDTGVDIEGTTTERFRLPTSVQTCGFSYFPPAGNVLGWTPPPASASCTFPGFPISLGADAADNIWIIASGDNQDMQLIPARAY
jgi:hypothetical protein